MVYSTMGYAGSCTETLLYGARTPFVLRQVEGSSLWRLVGDCYIHGVMSREAARSAQVTREDSLRVPCISQDVLLCGTLCRGIVVVRYAVPWYYMLYRWYHLCGSKVASTSSPWFHSSRGVYIEPLIP